MNLKECTYKQGIWIETATGQICGMYQSGTGIIALSMPYSSAALVFAKNAANDSCLFRGGCELYAVFLGFNPPNFYYDNVTMKAFLSRLLAATGNEIDSVESFPIMSLN